MDLATHVLHLDGAASRPQLLDAGFTDADIRQACRSGVLSRVRRGAYVGSAGCSGHSRAGLAAVAVARSRPGEALSHASAVAAWGLPLVGASDRRFELLRPGVGPTESPSPNLTVRRATVPLRPLVPWRDVLAVHPATAIAQLSLTGRWEAAVVAGDAAVARVLCRPDDLLTALGQLDPAVGLARAGRALALVDGRSESPGESLLRLRLLDLGVHAEPQVDLRDERGFVGRVDLLDRERRCVYEFDGAVKYEGAEGRDELVREKRREDRLRRLGYRVVRVMWSDLEPARLRALVRGSRAAA